MHKHAIVALFVLVSMDSQAETFTLYRSSQVIDAARIHVATFDADEQAGQPYNSQNCEQAAELFQQQPGVITRFWCEKGHYRKKPSAASRADAGN